MGSQGDVLRLLDGLGVQEGKAALPDGADDGEIREGGRIKRDMDHDGVLGEAVEKWDGGEEDC